MSLSRQAMHECTSLSRRPEIHQTIVMIPQENNVLSKPVLPAAVEIPKTLQYRTFSSLRALIHQLFPEKILPLVGFEFTRSTRVQKEACLNLS